MWLSIANRQLIKSFSLNVFFAYSLLGFPAMWKFFVIFFCITYFCFGAENESIEGDKVQDGIAEVAEIKGNSSTAKSKENLN